MKCRILLETRTLRSKYPKNFKRYKAPQAMLGIVFGTGYLWCLDPLGKLGAVPQLNMEALQEPL